MARKSEKIRTPTPPQSDVKKNSESVARKSSEIIKPSKSSLYDLASGF
jgi:hypothetical protein